MELILGLPIPESFGPPGIHKLQEDCFADLAATSGEREICDTELGPVRFSFFTSPNDHPLIGPLWKHPGNWRKYHLLTATVDARSYLDTLIARFQSSEEAFFRTNAEQLAIGFAAKDFEMEMRKLLLLANMLRPGSINAGEGWVLYNSNFIERSKPFYAEHLYEAVKAANVANWPPFQEVSIRDAWLWLESADCLSSGVGTGPLGRAWAALSQIIKSSLNDDSSIQLIWVLIGLEALYAEGNLGLREQLVTKTEVLLGRREKNKKDFGAIYDYRSRLIHGNVDLPFSYMLFDSSKEHDAFKHELTRRSALALAVLIATLQLMASRSWTALEFTLSVSGRHVAPRDGGH